MSDNAGIKIIGDIAILYELSLAIGQSLDLIENCDLFCRTLMARKNFGYAAVWVKNKYLPYGNNENFATLVYANPEYYVRERNLPLEHQLFTKLREQDFFVVNTQHDQFGDFVNERRIPNGIYLVFALGDIGVLTLFSISNNSADEVTINQLVNIISKFVFSLEGCLAYQKLAMEIRERKRAEDALQGAYDELEVRVRERTMELEKSEAKNRSLLNAIPDSMFRINKHGTFLDAKITNDAMSLFPPGSFLHKNIYEVWPPELARQYMLNIEQVMKIGRPQVFEYQFPAGGKVTHQEIRIVNNGEDEVLAIVRDITERKKMEEQLQYLSLHDSLTGLYNRTYFEWEMRRLNDERYTSVSIIVCDLDGLKLINDTLGHTTGDKLLTRAADVIRRCFRKEDIVARIGGDEFAIIMLDNLKPIVEKACLRIRDTVAEYNTQNPDFPLSISAGFAVGGVNTTDINEVFREADNNMYREKLHRSQSTRSAVVQGLTKALEARDFITEGHADRLQEMMGSIGMAIGLSQRSIADLRLFAQFHDIGKVGIPDSILFKPGTLTPEEFTVMQRHCEIGYRIAYSVPDLVPIAGWILKHHEWWNGKGYPLGISGEEIPLECRILAIADAFDAMTSDRPYRKAMNCAEAITELRRCAGTQFDPQLVEDFVRVVENQS